MISSIAILYEVQGSGTQRINGKENDGEGKVRAISGMIPVFSDQSGREGKALLVWWTESFFFLLLKGSSR